MQRIAQSGEGLGTARTELYGLARSIAELEWLLLLLVMLYSVVTQVPTEERIHLAGAMVLYAALVVSFNFVDFSDRKGRWKLGLRIWLMVAFVAWVVWYSGKVSSPLLSLYLVAVITSALVLGRLATFTILGMVTASYAGMGYVVWGARVWSVNALGELMSRFTPVLITAYVTTMLASDLRYAQRVFKALSETDELTGLLNLRAFIEVAERELVRSARYGHSFSIAMLDADRLKAINDSYGHEAGNKLIQLVAENVCRVLRGSDVVGRFGGDEFVILLPECSLVDAQEATERVRASLAEVEIVVGVATVSTTVSIGVASYPRHGNTIRELMECADAAMYQSKQAGRNRVRVVGGQESDACGTG